MKTPSNNEQHILRGIVEAVYFADAQFSAGRLRTDSDKSVTFSGPFMAKKNERMVLHGRWIVHAKYGRQFQVEALEYDLEYDAFGLSKYLANHPNLKGIGPVKARKIVARYGDCFETALAEKTEEMAKFASVPLSTICTLRDEWKKTRAFNAAFSWLSGFGLTYRQVTKLVDNLGNNVVGVLKENPYLLIREIKGFGFRKVDQIALRMGFPKEHEGRIRAGIVYCVDEAIKQGDCYLDHQELLYRANTLLVMDVLDSQDRICREIDYLLETDELGSSNHFSRMFITRPYMLQMERELFHWFTECRIDYPQSDKPSIFDEYIEVFEPPLNDNQKEAASMAFDHTISVISGGAGVGKTFTIAAIAEICESTDLELILCAPTGKAAKRLEEVAGQKACTIHRLLGYDGKEFKRGPDNPISTDFVILDEMSMVDVPLAWHLFRALDLKRASVLMVGDHNQLPPVGPGYILRDLVRSNVVPKTVLTTVVRQAGALKKNCTAVLEGEIRKTAEPEDNGPKPWILVNQLSEPEQVQRLLLEMFDEIIPDRLGFHLLRDVQVLTPTHKGPIGTRELNIGLQRLLQKKLWDFEVPPLPPNRRPHIYLRDKVIQTRNNYRLDVMNGTMGIVTSVQNDKSIVVNFEGRHVPIKTGSDDMRDLELAYALTVHRVQGSEFPCSVVIVHKSHSFMHHRNLFYTAVSRAKKTAIILGDAWGIRNAAEQLQVNKRRTFLSVYLEEYQDSMRDDANRVLATADNEEKACLP